MKISLFLVLIGTLQMLAENSYSQSARLTLDMKSVTIKDVLSRIEEQSKFYFLYDNGLIDVYKKVDIAVKDERLDVILNKLFGDGKVKIDIKDRHIILTPTEVHASQQTKLVSGKVSDPSGAPLPGVSVLIKGTTIGAITNTEGVYNLPRVPANATLIFSFIGMKTQEIQVGGSSTINVTLKEESVGIEEVVAVGYGTMRKSDFTGVAGKVKVEGVEERPYTNVDGALQGRIAGVQITANTGTPGGEMTFNIRGATSTSGDNQPLFVVDGYPIETSNNMITLGAEGTTNDLRGAGGLSGINPSDIESVEVLKDASATAIYGSRAANGVVMITTKRGKAGRDKVEYNVRFDFSSAPPDLGLLNTKEFMDLYNEAYRNTNPTAAEPYYKASDYEKLPDINWQKLILQGSFGHTHSLNLSGGDPKMRYAVNASYTDLDGSVKYASNFKRGTMRVNLDREMSKKFSFGMSVAGDVIANQAVGQSNLNGNVNGSIINALLTAPVSNPYDEYGDLANLRNSNGGGNPLTLVKNVKDLTKTYHFNVNTNAVLTIINGLTVNARVGMDYRRIQRNQYQPRDTRIGMSSNGYAYSGEGDQRSYLGEYTTNYIKTFAKHRINAVAGFTHQEWQNRNYASVTKDFASDALTYYAPQTANQVETPQGRFQESAMNSWLARVGYSYDDRYMLMLTGRADGSTRLAPGHKWQSFPSVGIAWNMNNEAFMKRQQVISRFKVRGSWGISGNQSVGIGASQSVYGYAKYSFQQKVTTGYTISSMENPNLGWERTSQVNFGIETGYFNNRYTFTFDMYKKRTTDLLFSKAIPAYTGLTNLMTNSGIVENRGLEFEASAGIIQKKVKWTASGNLSINRNKVISLGGEDFMLGQYFNANIGATRFFTCAQVGRPIGVFYGYKVDGIYQTAEEVAAGPQDDYKRVGGWKWLDVSGPDGTPDGKVDASDQVVIGSPYPKFTFGLNNDISWKGISLSVFILGSQGNQILNMYRIMTDALAVTANPPNTTREVYEHRWTGPGTSNKYPIPLFNNDRFNKRPNDAIMEEGSYIKLKTVTLSYDLPVKRSHIIQKLRVFITGNNLLTITNYTGFDPEINSYGFNSMAQGLDLGSMPQVRSFSTGLIIGF